MHDFSLVSDGRELDGTIFYPPGKKDKYPAILFVHGWTAERKRSFQYANSLADLGYVCLLFDMRGHGASEGDRKQFYQQRFLKRCHCGLRLPFCN